MKKLIFQYYFDDKLFLDKRDDIGKAILPYSIKSVMAYAQKIGADYKLCANRNFPHLPIQCEKLRVLEEKNYDKILVVDTDVIIPQSITINIFNEYRDVKLALRGSPPPLRFMSSRIVKSETAPLDTATIDAAAACSKVPSISANPVMI